jgi:hypothetical protein
LPLVARINQFLETPSGDNSAFKLMNEIKDAEHEYDMLYSRLQSYIHSTYPLNVLETDGGLATVATVAAEFVNEESNPPQ